MRQRKEKVDLYDLCDPRRNAHTVIPEGTHHEEFGGHKMPIENQCGLKSANTYYRRKAMKHKYIDD